MTTTEPQQIVEAVEPLRRMPAIIELGKRAAAAVVQILEVADGTDPVSRALIVSSHANAQAYNRAYWNSRNAE